MAKKSTGLCLAGAIAGYFVLWLTVPKATFIPVITGFLNTATPFAPDDIGTILSFVGLVLTGAPTVAFMAVQIAIAYFYARFDMTWYQCTLILAGSIALIAGAALAMVWQSEVTVRMGRYPNLLETLVLMATYPSVLRMPMFAGIMLASSSIGYLVSLRVRDRNLLLPVVMFAAYIDFWTVTRGPVSAVLEKAPEVVAAVSAPIPHVGTGSFVPRTMIGPGDFLFMALVFAAVHRLGLNGPRNYWFVFGAMTLGMLSVVFGLLPTLPALILLALAVVAANWGKFKLTRQEVVSTVIVGAIMLASLPLAWTLVRKL
ncbi:MAG: hypothetical protein N3B12_00245 [Armatimonadetes bacterium]|nr:hypothetical protein [Armatimonadota bacterium]